MAEKQYKPMPELSAEEIALFWSKVDKTPGHGPKGDCWKWMGSMNNGERGVFHIHGQRFGAHRVALFLATGKDPGNFLAIHGCDWAPCMRHLRPGTVDDNVADRVERGRTTHGDAHWARKTPEKVKRGPDHVYNMHPELRPTGKRNGSHTHPEKVNRGESVGTSKLTTEQVLEIRARVANGERKRPLGREFKVSHTLIRYIATGKSWAHVPMQESATP